ALDEFHRLETVRFQRLHQFGLKRRAAPTGAEGTVASGTTGTSGNLSKLGRIELTELIAVEFAVGGESDMVDIEVQPHADCVRRHQIVDLPRLVEIDLRVARARRQRAEHDRGPTALPTDQFRDRVNLFGRKRDDRGTPGQSRKLFFAGESKPRQSRPADDAGAWQ